MAAEQVATHAPPRPSAAHRVAERAGRVWERTWFAAGHPATLTSVRWVVFTTAAVEVWTARGSLRALADRPSVLWEPISGLAAVGMPQPDRWLIEVLVAVVVVGSTLTLLRRWPRWTGAAAAGAYAVLAATASSFGKIDHDRHALVVMLLVLALAPIPPGRAATTGAAGSWRWHWPVQLCRAALGVMLAAAALSKLQASGLAWASSENMRNILVVQSLTLRDPALEGLARWIAGEPWRWKAAAAGALVGEASLVWALVVRSARLRTLLVVTGIGTVAGITLLMDLVGFPIVVLGAVFVTPAVALDAGATLRTWMRAVVPALLGLAALGAVMVLHHGGPTLTLLPLGAVAAYLLVATRPPGDAPPVSAPSRGSPGTAR